MSAEFVDALKGYEIYLKSRGEATIEDVNHTLKVHGRKAIQQRTYGHYRKLLAHGFRTYVPINKFDVFQALGRLQMAADRRRYDRVQVAEAGGVSLDRQHWRDARIVDKSLVGLGLAMSTTFAARKGSTVWIRMPEHDMFPAILVWKATPQDDSRIHLGVRAIGFLANYRRGAQPARGRRPTAVFQLSRTAARELAWNDLYRVIAKSHELLEAVDALIYSVEDVMDRGIVLAPPILETIDFGSPGSLRTKVDLGVAEIIKVLIEKVQFWGKQRRRYEQENRRRELDNANLSLEIARNAVNLRSEAIESGLSDEVIEVLVSPIREMFDTVRLPRGLFGAGTPERGILTERVLPAVTELVDGDDPDFEIAVLEIPKRARTPRPIRSGQRRRPARRK